MIGKVVSHYKILEHLGGESINRGPLQAGGAIDITIQLAQGLRIFHGSGLG